MILQYLIKYLDHMLKVIIIKQKLERKHHQMHKCTTVVSDLNNVKRLFKKRTLVNRIETSTKHLQHTESRRIISQLCT